MRYIDINGDQTDNMGEILCEQYVSESITVVYRKTKEDIRALVESLKKSGLDESKLMLCGETILSESYWTTTACTKTNGTCSGSCTSGSCKEVSNGHFSYCGCA